MKKLAFVLCLLLLVSCSPENLWQKAGVAKPEPISISGIIGNAAVSEDKKVDVFGSFTTYRDSSIISFSIDTPSGFDGKILCPQSKEEAEKMAQMLNAKCFDKDKIKKYLSSEIQDEDLVKAMKNTVSLLDGGKESLKNMVVDFFPVFTIDEDTDDVTKEIIEAYNSLKYSVKDYSDKFIEEIFKPLVSILSSSQNPTWGEYVRCQLMVNLLSGVLESMESTVDGVMAVLFSNEMKEFVYNLGSEEEKEELLNNLQEVGVSALLEIANSVVSAVLSPLAIYNSISYSYGEDIGLMPVTEILNKIMGEAK